MKKLIIVLTLVLFEVCTLMASPAAINFENLPKDEKFEKLFTDFGNAYYSIKYPDISNKDSKKEELKIANALYSYLKKKKNANYDERLLKLLTGRCLYNFDQVKFADVEKDFNSLEKDFPENAEHHWIYGNLLATTGKTLEAKNQLEKYMEMKNYYIGSFFIEDYAYAQFMCNMPFNALYSLTNGGRIPEEAIQNQQLLGMIKNHIKESSSTENYELNQVWNISAEEDGYNFIYSTMLGVSFPCKGNWKLNYNQFANGKPAMCIFNIDGLTLNDSPAGISLIMLLYPQSTNPIPAVNKLLNSFKIISKENVQIDKKSFVKYTYEDLEKYNDARQGSRGYIYAATIEPGEWSGARCEHAVNYYEINQNNKSEGTKYYAIAPSQNRLQEPVTIVMLVDSCNALIEQTDQILSELLNKAKFD